MNSCQIWHLNASQWYTDVLWNLTAVHFVDFEVSREKSDFLKTTIRHLGLNRGSNIFRVMIRLLFLFTVIIIGIGIDCNPDAARLYDDLLTQYTRLIRPVKNYSDTVTIKLGLRLSQIVDLVSSKLKTKSLQLCHSLNIENQNSTYQG